MKESHNGRQNRLITKSPQPDPFHLMYSQISVDHQRSRLKP